MAYIGKRPVDTFPAINAVTTTLIADNAVTAVKIAENSITSRELAANTISTSNIADNSIDSTKIAQNSILTRHIDDAQVTADQLASDSVITVKILDANVTSAKIANNAILTQHIDDNQITADQLADDAVDTAAILNLNVTTAKLAATAVTTAKITDANVTTAKIADDAVTLAKMAGLSRGSLIYGNSSGNPTVLVAGSSTQVLKSDGTDISWGADSVLTTEQVQDITGAMFSSNTETGISASYEDGDGTIDLVVGTLNQNTTGSAATLATGRTIGMTGDVVWTSPSFDGSGNVTAAGTIQANAVESAMIAENNITTREIAANTIATGNIADNAIDSTKIAQNSILTRHIDDGQVTTDQLGADAVTGAKIADDAINSEHYTDGSIDTAHIADDQVTAAKLANTAVTAAAYGSSSAIPVITIDAQGRITAASTAATSSVLTIAADSGSNDTVTVGTDTLTFEGTANEIETTVSNNKINVGLPTNVTIAGNLTVAGTQTTVSSTTITVADPLVSLATSNNAADAVDIGIYGLYDTSGSQDLYSGLFRDASDSGKWKLFKDNQAAPTTTVNTGGTGYATGTLVANLEGNVTGNVTGNTSGTAGSATGNAATATALATARTIGGTSFDGTANIAVATATEGTNVTVSANNSTDETVYPTFVDGATGTQGIETDTGLTYNPSSGTLTSTVLVGAVTGNVTGNASGTAATVTGATQAAITSTANLATVGTIGTGVWQGTAIASGYIAADAITGAKIADDAINSEHYTDGSIDTAHIADDQVTLAKMAGIARGKVIYGDASGNPAALALGTSGYVLKSDGTDIAWAADAGLSTEQVQDIAGGMFTSNTETGITATYQDGDGTVDLVIGTGGIASTMIADDAITQAKINDDAVGADQLAVNSVVSASIVNASIVGADIAANTITVTNIADDAVESDKIANNAILTQHIDDNQITGDQLADDIVLSGTGSIRMPDGTTAQRPGSPAAGMFRYNTTLGKFEGYTSGWGEIGGGTSAWSSDTMTGDGSDVTLTLSAAPDSEADVIVFIDGVFQNQDSYNVSGTTLTFDTAPVSGRYVRAYTIKQAVSGTNLTHNAFSGDGSDTTFTLSIAPVHENNTQVYIDGVYQFKGTYSVSGTTLTFSTAPPNGTAIECMTMNQLDINVPVDATITSAKLSGVLTMPNVLTVKSYTVSALPTVVAGGVIFVTNESGGAVLAFSDGTNWRRSTDRAVVS